MKKEPKYITNPKYQKEKEVRAFKRKFYAGFDKKHRFSKIEIKHLFWAWLAISVAFANVLKGRYYPDFLGSFIISSIAVGTGFLFHEMSHKFVAQKYGIVAEFRAFFPMLLLAVILSFTGIVFAAPGAVMIMGRPNKKQNGLISIAGPATNIVLALIFFSLLFLNWQSQLLISVLFYGFIINIWLALFNLLPFAIFDGKKVFDWNKAVWAVAVVICLTLFLMQGFVASVVQVL